MAIQLGENEYRARQYGSGITNSGPCGKRKMRKHRQFLAALAQQGKEYWARYGKSVHGVPYPVRCIYWA